MHGSLMDAKTWGMRPAWPGDRTQARTHRGQTSLCGRTRSREARVHPRILGDGCWATVRPSNRGSNGCIASCARGGCSEPVCAIESPVRYYASLLFPLSALLGVFGEQVAAWLTSNTILKGLWHAAAAAGITELMLATILSYSGLVFAYGCMPLGDIILGRDPSPPGKDAENKTAFRIPLYVFVSMHLAVVLLSCCQAPGLLKHPAHYIGVLLGTGSCGAVAFTAAHELLHSRHKLDRFLCNILLCPLFYMHWTSSHLSHHQKVGTVEDHATARYGESLFEFIPRSIVGSIRDAVTMETKRLGSVGKPFSSFQNRLWAWVLAPVTLALSINLVLGQAALIMLLGSAMVSILMLESVNYIEHYGLQREKGDDGKYEPIGPQHSWNADWVATSSMTFQLQRHSHHHAKPCAPYQSLQSDPKAPQLAASYPIMMMMSVCPPLFFAKMNPRLAQVKRELSALKKAKTTTDAASQQYEAGLRTGVASNVQ